MFYVSVEGTFLVLSKAEVRLKLFLSCHQILGIFIWISIFFLLRPQQVNLMDDISVRINFHLISEKKTRIFFFFGDGQHDKKVPKWESMLC